MFNPGKYYFQTSKGQTNRASNRHVDIVKKCYFKLKLDQPTNKDSYRNAGTHLKIACWEYLMASVCVCVCVFIHRKHGILTLGCKGLLFVSNRE